MFLRRFGTKVIVPKTRRVRREMPAPIILTQAAADRIKVLLQNKPEAIGLRIGVRTRGCSGMSYTMNYATEKAKMEDEVNDKGVRVFVEPKALFHIVGTTMDYKITPVSAEFTFENPNAKGTCGCGESFNA
ncbi:iron-sulfur cluster assembly protein [Thraustotheca clavata]|uniref:Iron-sulfur cluster assembly protein n=1 Tax=Thraustotheca clavata TaxID=74557 RepID=A0A1V9ZW90_9STRA|nr:iron-sulfur cluster assembly protein [Thraustotheca clavata]